MHTINIFYKTNENFDTNESNLDRHVGYVSDVTEQIFNRFYDNDESSCKKMIFIGHGIGSYSYIALKVAEKFYDKIDKIYLTTPKLEHVNKTMKYTTLRIILRFRIIIKMICSILAILLKILSIIPD
jgi:hypothetical protein